MCRGNEQQDNPILTLLGNNNILNQDISDAQIEEDDSDYDNIAGASGDEVYFVAESDNEEPYLTLENDANIEHVLSMQPLPTVRLAGYESRMLFYSRKIPYLDQFPGMSYVDALTMDLNKIRTAMWDETRSTELCKNMLLNDKAV